MNETIAESWQEKRDRERREEGLAEIAFRNTPEWKAAGRIVKHLWIIFVCLPIVLGILFAILTAK